MEDYFTLTRTSNEAQRLAHVGLCLEGEALDWWNASRRQYTTWAKVRQALEDYYGDHYQQDKAYSQLVGLKQTGTIEQYLNDIDRLNVKAGLMDRHLISIILNGIPS